MERVELDAEALRIYRIVKTPRAEAERDARCATSSSPPRRSVHCALNLRRRPALAAPASKLQRCRCTARRVLCCAARGPLAGAVAAEIATHGDHVCRRASSQRARASSERARPTFILKREYSLSLLLIVGGGWCGVVRARVGGCDSRHQHLFSFVRNNSDIFSSVGARAHGAAAVTADLSRWTSGQSRGSEHLPAASSARSSHGR